MFQVCNQKPNTVIYNIICFKKCIDLIFFSNLSNKVLALKPGNMEPDALKITDD